MSGKQKSGVHIGSIGNISDIKGAFAIGGDAVQGNHNIIGNGNITTNESLPPMGFATTEAKKQFMNELSELRNLVIDIQADIKKKANEHAEAKQLTQELSNLEDSLQEAKKHAGELTVGQTASPEKVKTLDFCLKAAENLIGKAKQFGETVAELEIKLMPIALPVWSGIRSLLKL